MQLNIQSNGESVGHIGLDAVSGLFTLHYDPAWINSSDGHPLSPHLPFHDEDSTELKSIKLKRFLENLLPEGEALEDIVRSRAISKSNLWAIVQAIGHETTGALSFSPEDAAQTPHATSRLITNEELSERIRSRDHFPFSLWDEKIRLSLAGHQSKLGVYLKDGKRYLVDGPGLATTHILKPEPISQALKGLTTNEFFCMRLALSLGLPTAKAQLLQVPEPVLCIERCDRKVQSNGLVEKLHIIDGCQLLSLPSSAKYEREHGDSEHVKNVRTGASLPAFFAESANMLNPVGQKNALLRWTVFQVLIGNADAHAKNLSFFMTRAGVSLAPSYDLVSVTAMKSPSLNDQLAMAIGDAFDPKEVLAYAWASMASDCGLNAEVVKKRINTMAAIAKIKVEEVKRQVVSEGAEAPVANAVASVILENCDRQLESAKNIAEMALFLADEGRIESEGGPDTPT